MPSGTGKQKPPTAKQLFFALEYLKDHCAKRAYKVAYRCTNDNVAAVEGHKLLRHPKIAPLIAHSFQKQVKRLEVDADRVATELAHVAFLDPAEMYDDRNALLPVREMPEHVRRAVASVKTTELFEWIGEGDAREKVLVGYTKEVKLWSKPVTLEMQGKRLKMWSDPSASLAESLAELVVRTRSDSTNGSHPSRIKTNGALTP